MINRLKIRSIDQEIKNLISRSKFRLTYKKLDQQISRSKLDQAISISKARLADQKLDKNIKRLIGGPREEQTDQRL